MKKRGFTLVELIAVIAVMSALLVIAGVNIYKFRDNANRKALLNIKQNIEKATEMYIESNSNDIIYKCTMGTADCICDKGYTSASSQCKITFKNLLNKGIYGNIDSTSECMNVENGCCVSNPVDESCLDTNIITIKINPNSNTAEATIE